MAASLSATPQPFTVSSLTSTGAILGVTGTITGAFTPSGGIVGNTSGTAAPAGYVGEVLTSAYVGSIGAGAGAPITGVTLTPGSWYCSGNVSFTTLSSAGELLESFLYLSGNAITSTQNILNAGSPIFSNYTQMPTGAYFTTISSAESLYIGAYSNVAASSVTGYISCLRVR
jgi:hypothetical protein